MTSPPFRVEMTHGGIVRAIAGAIGVAMALYHMWAIATGVPEAMIFRGTHLLFAMTLVFLWYRRREGVDRTAPEPLDYALLAISATAIVYLFVNYSYVVNRIYYVDDLYPTDMVLGVLLVLLVLEGTRRVIGLALPITAVVFLVYALAVAQVEPMRLMDQLYLTTEGIFGPTLGVSATFVMIFVLFGSFMERTGTGQLFMDFALSLTGHTAGGPGKVSVISSSLFGTISGSAVANVMVDGPITIPLMKRSGFKPHFAAGVEAVASTGGQIMPPIMGAAAFVMAEFLQVSYMQVTLWALIPAFLYYVACFAAVHFEAKRLGLVGVPRADLPRLGQVLRERGHLFIPVLVILVGMYSGYSAPLCALAGTLACFPVAALRANTRGNVTLANLIDALIDGARNALSVAMACACAGIVIGCITLTGLGIVFTQVVVALAQSSLFLALVLTAFAGIVLGMGMPTTPAYIVMTALLVPAIAKLGAPIPAAHMFAFYFAILSAITPPVALAVYAAASLAKSDLWTTGWAAVRIGAAGFLVPFAFVYQPAILMIGPWTDTVIATVSATIGVTFLAAGLHGYLVRRLAPWEQGWFIVAAVLMVDPGIVTDLIGYAMAGAGVAYQYATRTRKAAAWN